MVLVLQRLAVSRVRVPPRRGAGRHVDLLLARELDVLDDVVWLAVGEALALLADPGVERRDRRRARPAAARPPEEARERGPPPGVQVLVVLALALARHRSTLRSSPRHRRRSSRNRCRRRYSSTKRSVRSSPRLGTAPDLDGCGRDAGRARTGRCADCRVVLAATSSPISRTEATRRCRPTRAPTCPSCKRRHRTVGQSCQRRHRTAHRSDRALRTSRVPGLGTRTLARGVPRHGWPCAERVNESFSFVPFSFVRPIAGGTCACCATPHPARARSARAPRRREAGVILDAASSGAALEHKLRWGCRAGSRVEIAPPHARCPSVSAPQGMRRATSLGQPRAARHLLRAGLLEPPEHLSGRRKRAVCAHTASGLAVRH